MAGTLPLHELEKIIGEVHHDESVATASGWVTQKLGGFPKAGDTLTVGECELRVEEMDGPRVAPVENHPHAKLPVAHSRTILTAIILAQPYHRAAAKGKDRPLTTQ